MNWVCLKGLLMESNWVCLWVAQMDERLGQVKTLQEVSWSVVNLVDWKAEMLDLSEVVRLVEKRVER